MCAARQLYSQFALSTNGITKDPVGYIHRRIRPARISVRAFSLAGACTAPYNGGTKRATVDLISLTMAVIKNPTNIASPAAKPLVVDLARRGMVQPALLYVAAHRPLAYAAGHMLAVAAPLAAVLGFGSVQRWADVLIAPGAAEHLERMLGGAPTEHAP
jgi:hypothetical protein